MRAQHDRGPASVRAVGARVRCAPRFCARASACPCACAHKSVRTEECVSPARTVTHGDCRVRTDPGPHEAVRARTDDAAPCARCAAISRSGRAPTAGAHGAGPRARTGAAGAPNDREAASFSQVREPCDIWTDRHASGGGGRGRAGRRRGPGGGGPLRAAPDGGHGRPVGQIGGPAGRARGGAESAARASASSRWSVREGVAGCPRAGGVAPEASRS